MPLMEWNDTLSLGIDTVDNHHKKLISMINSLYDAMLAGHSKDTVAKILSALLVYTDKHFKYEEQLFEKYNYRHSIEHKQQHDNLLKQVVALNEKFNCSKVTISVELLKFLKKWMTEHIMEEDKMYCEFLIAHGVK